MNALVESHKAQKAALVSGAAVAGIVPTTIEEVFRLAGAVHAAGLAPYGLETPEKLTIAIMTGLEVGLPPMQAVQSIAVINNRPTIWGDGLMAIVRRSVLCRYIKEWIEGEGDAMVAYCETLRHGENAPVVRSFSVDDAKKARLWQTMERVQKKRKDGSTYEAANDSPWFRFQKRMLQMRARALCLRDVYADLTRGIQVREEVEDYPVREAAPAPEPRQAIESVAARLALRGPHAAATNIVDHVAAETNYGGEDDGGATDATGDAGTPASEPANEQEAASETADAVLSESDVTRLADYAETLAKVADQKMLMQAHNAWFGITDPADDPLIGTFRSIYQIHHKRLSGKLTAEQAASEVDKIIGGGNGR